ncbi:MAG: ATP-binding protein [Nocardiopsaceae bacterium]|nr:ATP-binding protein [Nocardiopsaceae bacterium]
MTGAEPVGSATLAERATAGVLADLSRVNQGAGRGVVVDSPPGAGKSALVVRAAGELAEAGERVMVVAQTNEQVNDLVDRLATDRSDLRIGRLSASDYVPAERVARHQTVTVSEKAADLADHAVVLGTAHKWAMTGVDAARPWAIIDEAYQMRADLMLRVARLFTAGLFVGDPGQLDPFSTVATERWTGLSWDPTQSAVSVLLRNNPDIPVHMLPVSWRLPASAAPVVSEAFYPFTGFRAGTTAGERTMEWNTRAFGMNALDCVLETAAADGWALCELPALHTLRTDAEVADTCAALAARLLQRGAVARSELGEAAVTASRIAIGAAHRDQAQAVRAALAARGVAGITVDTANRLQGREFDLVVVWHPLSGRRDATAFHLESGRLCVLTSRHRHACVVVARAGIPELLDAHPSAEPMFLNVPAKFPDGWEANQSLLVHLSRHRVRAA